MLEIKNVESKIHYTLRIASAMCFIGHGSFGIIGKTIWSDYFSVFGIGHDLSFRLMPYVGGMDIVLGIILLFYPIRAILLWLVVWGAITAFLRPLSGEPFYEFIERAGNFGAPLALLFCSSATTIQNLFKPVKSNIKLDVKSLNRLMICLRLAVFFLFIGHGCLNLIEKDSLLKEYMSLGFVNPGKTAEVIGLLEIIGGLSILIRPLRIVVFSFFIWKMLSELFYPQYELFEFVERGGSYGVLLALWFALQLIPVFKKNKMVRITPAYLLNNRPV